MKEPDCAGIGMRCRDMEFGSSGSIHVKDVLHGGCQMERAKLVVEDEEE